LFTGESSHMQTDVFPTMPFEIKQSDNAYELKEKGVVVGCMHIITCVIWLMVFTLIINGIMYRDILG